MILLDTNILVHAAGAQSLRHAKAKELRDQAVTGEFEGCMAAQVLTEFYAVVTDPRRFRPPLTPSQAQREIRAYLSSPLKLILPKETTVTRMLNLLGSKSVRSGKIFDVFLAATSWTMEYEVFTRRISMISKRSMGSRRSILSLLETDVP